MGLLCIANCDAIPVISIPEYIILTKTASSLVNYCRNGSWLEKKIKRKKPTRHTHGLIYTVVLNHTVFEISFVQTVKRLC